MTDTFTVAPWGKAYPGVVKDKPSFTFRFMTIGECRALNSIMGPASEVRGREVEDAERLAEFLKPFHVQQPGAPADLLKAFDAMMPHELDRLAWRIRVANRMGPDEKKDSESPSPTSTEESAAGDAKTAPTGQPSSSPRSSTAPSAEQAAAANAGTRASST